MAGGIDVDEDGGCGRGFWGRGSGTSVTTWMGDGAGAAGRVSQKGALRRGIWKWLPHWGQEKRMYCLSGRCGHGAGSPVREFQGAPVDGGGWGG